MTQNATLTRQRIRCLKARAPGGLPWQNAQLRGTCRSPVHMLPCMQQISSKVNTFMIFQQDCLQGI